MWPLTISFLNTVINVSSSAETSYPIPKSSTSFVPPQPHNFHWSHVPSFVKCETNYNLQYVRSYCFEYNNAWSRYVRVTSYWALSLRQGSKSYNLLCVLNRVTCIVGFVELAEPKFTQIPVENLVPTNKSWDLRWKLCFTHSEILRLKERGYVVWNLWVYDISRYRCHDLLIRSVYVATDGPQAQQKSKSYLALATCTSVLLAWSYVFWTIPKFSQRLLLNEPVKSMTNKICLADKKIY